MQNKKLIEAVVNVMKGTHLNESEDMEITKKVTKIDPDAIHIKSEGHQHLYSGGSDPEAHHYMVYHADTGKVRHITLEHDGEPLSSREVKQHAGKAVHPNLVKAIHKDHKEDLLHGYDD